MENVAQRRIDAFLATLREGLRGMNEAEAGEIVKELRSHVTEKASAAGELTEASVEATLAALGSPRDLAREYMTDEILSRMEASRSPLRLLDGLFTWATLSIAGFFALIASLAGYGFGLLCMLVAVLKPVHPQTAGLWSFLDATGDTTISLRLGFGPPPENGRELLSWWIVPIGLGLGFVCLLMTTSFARWCVRQVHRSRSESQSG